MNTINKSLIALLLTTAAFPVLAQQGTSAERLAQVADHGHHTMPFNLEKTQHVFSKTAHGGIQQVLVKDASDQEQVRLICQHLSDISEGFKRGDFSKQRYIHGNDMPGLEELAAANGGVRFDYRPLPNGAEIEFSAEQASLVDAIHRYFNAQLSDHGHHAMDGQSPRCKLKQHSHDGHHHGKHHRCQHQQQGTADVGEGDDE